MKYKKSMIIIMLAIFLFSITSVCASEIDTPFVCEDTSQMELSDNDKLIEENLQTSEDKLESSLDDNDEMVSAQTDTEVLNASSAKYSDLAEEINKPGNIRLEYKKYTYNNGATPITISEDNKIIDGNGAVIDMEGSTIRAFYVNASGVTFKDLTIKNANSGSDGGAIYFTCSGTVENCNFINNVAGYHTRGGALYFKNDGVLTNCNFEGNSASNYGGAVYFAYDSTGTVSNCNFIDNWMSGDGNEGGALQMDSGSVENCNFVNNKGFLAGAVCIYCGNVTNCNFTDNSANLDSGAIWLSEGIVANCNFKGNTAIGFDDVGGYHVAGYGGAIEISGSAKVLNCNFEGNSASDYGGAVLFTGDGGTVTNCNFKDNSASTYGGAVCFRSGSTGNVTNCNFTGNSASTYGGAVYFGGSSTGNVTNCNFEGNTASTYGGAVYFNNIGVVTNCNFEGNTANSGGAIRSIRGVVSNCNFIDNKATDNHEGGAILMSSATVINCNFTANTAVNGNGGAVYLHNDGTVTNCNFEGNTANSGGAIRSIGGVVSNCNFIDNEATGIHEGGAILMSSGTVRNCNFKDNSAYSAGAILMSSGTVINCNFDGNTAFEGGGAVCFSGSTGNVINCNFDGNTAFDGGAVYFSNGGSVTNCNFTANNAVNGNGGAVYLDSDGTVTNCNFTANNAVNGNGGAVYLDSDGTLTNCNFDGNTAVDGGAVYFNNRGSVTNCNFDGNTAVDGGAVYFNNRGSVTNCNFEGNAAWGMGGAVWISSGTVTNCNFKDNSANSGGAVWISSGTVVLCTFERNRAFNVGGAICSVEKYSAVDTCIFKTSSDTINNNTLIFEPTFNVDNFTTFYKFDEKLTFDLRTNISSIPVTNGNISISVYFKDNESWFGNYSCLSGDGWTVDLPIGQYYAIYNTEYCGFTRVNRTITVITPKHSFSALNYMINSNEDSIINLNNDFYFDSDYDLDFIEGIMITRPITINGNGCTIDAKGKSRIFQVTSNNVVLENITFMNGYTTGSGGAVYFNSSGTVINCIFVNNTAVEGGAISSDGYCTADTCIFKTPSDTYNVDKILPPTLVVDDIIAVYTCRDNVTFDLKTNSGMPIYNGNISITLYNKTNGEWIGNYSYLSGESWTLELPLGQYYAIYNTEYENFSPVNKTITVIFENIFLFLNNTINGNDTPVINLYEDFHFNPAYDAAFVEGIVIDRPVIINGNGHTIDAKGYASIFKVLSEGTVIENLTLKNANCYGDTGAIYFDKSGNLSNCNFIGNYGHAVYFDLRRESTVTNCNFTNNSRSSAIFMGKGEVVNCNFNNNSDRAIDIREGAVTNCNFNNNSARAVYFLNAGTVTNCNFNNNNGGALYMGGYVEIANCNFTANTATEGGAVYLHTDCNMANCNFTNNSALRGGAIWFNKIGIVKNCSFTGNNATTGSAIYFYSNSVTKMIFNSSFINNKANAESFDVVRNENNLTIIFTGRNNLLNAIYSSDDAEVTFTNVTYWGAGGKTNTGNSSISLSGSNREAGQKITVSTVVNDELVLNNVYVTDENGEIVLDINVGDDYFIVLRHDEDSYYTEAEKSISNMTFNVSVTSQTTHNRTVNVTAKSNIFSEIMDGKLLFLIPNNDPIAANYSGNGIWWAVYTFDGFTDYRINVLSEGIDNVTVNKAIITITKANSTMILDNVVLNYGDAINVNIETEGALGIKAMIDGVDVGVINYAVPISGLNAGSYSLTVTTIPDENHTSVSKTANITVYKVNTVLTADSVSSTYNINKNLVITLKDANGNALSGVEVIIDLNGAKTYTTDNVGQIKMPTKDLAAKVYTVKITFNGNFNYDKSTKNVKVTVNKAANPLKVKAKTVKVKFSKLKKKAQKLKVTKVVKFTNKGQGTLTYKKVKGNKKIAINKKTGKVTIKKGLKKGTYKVKMKIKAKGNSNYMASSFKTVSFKIKIK